MDAKSIRSISDGVLCGLNPTLKQLVSEARRKKGHSPHAWILQDPHYPLDAVHGHALLESAKPYERRHTMLKQFLYRNSPSSLSRAGCSASVRQMGSCEACGRTDSLSLRPGNLGLPRELLLTAMPN